MYFPIRPIFSLFLCLLSVLLSGAVSNVPCTSLKLKQKNKCSEVSFVADKHSFVHKARVSITILKTSWTYNFILGSSFNSCIRVCTTGFCSCVFLMHYLVKRVNWRITNRMQCPIIIASPEEHRRVRLAQTPNTEINSVYKARNETDRCG